MKATAVPDGIQFNDAIPQARACSLPPETVSLVKDSWAKAAPVADQVAVLFYNRLFALDPSLKSLFKGDMVKQGAKLTAMIGVAVDKLDRFDTIVSDVEALGKRHVGYGVEDQNYDTVCAALLWTLEQGLGDSFTDDVKAAWTTVYGLLADTMKQAGSADQGRVL